MLNKKANDMYWDIKTIILVLIVLGILVYILYTYVIGPSLHVAEISMCENRGGTCIRSADACADDQLKIAGLGCPGKLQSKEFSYCCTSK